MNTMSAAVVAPTSATSARAPASVQQQTNPSEKQQEQKQISALSRDSKNEEVRKTAQEMLGLGTQEEGQSKVADGIDTTDRSVDSPLNPELRRILLEVSQTGTSSVLPWEISDTGNQRDGESSGSAHIARAAAGTTVVGSSTGSATSQSQRQPMYRRIYPGSSSSSGPPRKKPRNGLHATRPSQRRLPDGSGGGRKRPLTKTSGAAPSAASMFGPSNTGNGRASGSEQEDTSQYECDSEGTSATSNSEVSLERKDVLRQRAVLQAIKQGSATVADDTSVSHYKCLRDVFRAALVLVLDHWYKHRGGYRLSPAEIRRSATPADLKSMEGTDPSNGGAKAAPVIGSHQRHRLEEDIFSQRRQRLLNVLEPVVTDSSESTFSQWQPQVAAGPPYTIQRVAEVLLTPERYYTQTHKLCNCLEKLLLVTSTSSAFGGSTGGDTSQSRSEERELAALADEKGRLQMALRQHRLRRRESATQDALLAESGGNAALRASDAKKEAHHEKKPSGGSFTALSPASAESGDAASEEMILEAARASLRSKFDHVGMDPHSPGANGRDVNAMVESRSLTNSPPPPGHSLAPAAPIALPNHAGLLHPQPVARVPSPLLFNHTSNSDGSRMHANPNMQLLQINHQAAIANVSPLELMALEGGASAAVTAPLGSFSTLPKDTDLESRSSASSDVDSESDDVSFDDSASDRSDGSDSGHYELSAARAMARSRVQQQQRMQSRMLTSLQQQGEGSRAPGDSEYQSGDSIDSMRAEDSGGSDSSSSDMAD